MRTEDRIKKWVEIIEEIVRDYIALKSACDACFAAGVIDEKGPLFQAIWGNHQRMLQRIDVDDLISWYLYENEIGKNNLELKTRNHKEHLVISDTRKLAEIIVIYEDAENWLANNS